MLMIKNIKIFAYIRFFLYFCIMKTILREFETDVANKKYSHCPKGVIIGSMDCKKCKHFIAKISDSVQGINPITNKKYNIFLAKGIVECSKA